MAVVVGSARVCWDFAATVYILHAVMCAALRSFPRRWEWWLVNILNGVVTSLVGEWLCASSSPSGPGRGSAS